MLRQLLLSVMLNFFCWFAVNVELISTTNIWRLTQYLSDSESRLKILAQIRVDEFRKQREDCLTQMRKGTSLPYRCLLLWLGVFDFLVADSSLWRMSIPCSCCSVTKDFQ